MELKQIVVRATLQNFEIELTTNEISTDNGTVLSCMSMADVAYCLYHKLMLYTIVQIRGKVKAVVGSWPTQRWYMSSIVFAIHLECDCEPMNQLKEWR